MDWKAYLLGEGSPAERAAVAAHLAESAEAREDFERLEVTLAALRSLPDEEMPRRIAFVSDPVFAPSWWQRFWQAGPQWTFASAALVAVAILGHGWMSGVAARPVSAPMIAQSSSAPASSLNSAELKTVVDSAVAKALAEADNRQRELLRVALSDAEKRHETERQMMAASFDENLSLLRKQMNRMYVSTANLSVGGPQQ
jgi:anti-sigma factor RsiW